MKMSEDLLYLVKAEHELELLKNYLAGKLRRYGGISQSELENLCIMFGIIQLKEDDTDE